MYMFFLAISHLRVAPSSKLRIAESMKTRSMKLKAEILQ